MSTIRSTAIPAEAVELLNSGRLAHVVTLNPDGTPHLTCMWGECDGRTILFGAQAHRKKLTNLRRDPTISLSMESPDSNAVGIRYHLVIAGHAEIENDGYAELMERLARRYTGADRFFLDLHAGDVAFHQVRVYRHRIGGFGPWTGWTSRA